MAAIENDNRQMIDVKQRATFVPLVRMGHASVSPTPRFSSFGRDHAGVVSLLR
jgi:hypothetical protein